MPLWQIKRSNMEKLDAFLLSTCCEDVECGYFYFAETTELTINSYVSFNECYI